jgi:hypothetical protein
MQRKKLYLIFVFGIAFLNYVAVIANPIGDFCRNNKIQQKSVIIALNLSDCAVCYTPPDELLNGIRKCNSTIPVIVVTDVEMAAGEKNIFRSKFGTYGESLNFISDRSTYYYMISEKGGLPSVCCVSESGIILVFKHLKHDNLKEFYDVIKTEFEVFLINKTELKSSFISPKKFDVVFSFDNGVCLFHPGSNVIAKYNIRGENTKNVSIDSLNIDYLYLARQIFPGRLYKSSEENYHTNHPKRSRLIKAITLVKMSKDTLCALMNITATGDTMLNERPRKYSRGFSCLFLFDSNLNHIDTKFFSSPDEASAINFYMRGAYADNKFYLGRYDTLLRQDVVAEYESKYSKLYLKRQFTMPDYPETRNHIPIFPAICKSLNNVFVSCFKATDKGMVTAIKSYKLDRGRGVFNEEIVTDTYWAQMYTTPKGHFLLWTFNQDFTTQVEGYTKGNKQLIASKEKIGTRSQSSEPIYFVIDGFLHEYSYIE